MSNPNIAKDSPKTWKKGQSGNPAGRPPAEWTWSGLLKSALEETIPGDTRTYKELVAQSLRNKAIEGDVAAIKEFGNRIDGMPKQSVDETHSGEIVITIKDSP